MEWVTPERLLWSAQFFRLARVALKTIDVLVSSSQLNTRLPEKRAAEETASSLALATVWYARFYQAEPAPVVGTTKCPESLCPMLALPSSGIRVADSSEDITPRSLLLRTHSPILCGSPQLRLLASYEGSVQVATSPCCRQDLPDVISANLS